MREYFRIMLSDFNVMNEVDWEKWQKYSSTTSRVVWSVCVAVWLLNVILAIK